MAPRNKERRTVARHAHLPTPSRTKTGMRIFGVALGVLLVSGIAVASFVVGDLFHRIGDGAVSLEGGADVAPPGFGAYPDDRSFNIPIIGTDECGPLTTEILGERCREADGSVLNDVNLLVHVSAAPRNVTVLSLPRDLMVAVPECTREDGSTASALSKASINSVYQHAGLACVASTVSDLGDIPIEFAAKMSFDDLVAITDDIGGVDVCIGGNGINDHLAGIDHWPAGIRTVSGIEALMFIRTRHGVGDGSDLARVSNQPQYMSRLARTVLSNETLTDVSKVMRMANTIADNILPSKELANPLTLAQLALAFKDVPFSDFVFVQYPTLDDPDNPGIKVVPDESAAAQMWAAINSGQPLTITGDASNHGGVTAVEPTDEDASEEPTAPTTEPTAPTDPTDAPATPDGRATLPPTVTGISLEQETCANGKLN
ncbi:LCP family protein [Microbacterium sp.]|uniref:LCP family protein n=1 Tax=Microbacterium sp. TaxID=51671 RepID=UPI0039E5B96B